MPILNSLNTFLTILFVSLALGSNPAFAEPPSWAPAHGYYKNKGKGKHKKKRQHENYHETYRDDSYRERNKVNYDQITCDPAGITNSDIGTVIGGVIGGILGSKIGKGNGKTLATITGVIIGASIGNHVGASMDEADRYCAGQALVHAKDNQSVAWTNPDTQQEYTVTPKRSYTQNNGRYCRDYTSNVTVNGRQDQVSGTACKDDNDNWKIIN